MRVAVVTTSYPAFEGDPSGHFVAAEVSAMRARGDEVTVLRPAAGGAFGWPGVAARLRENPLRSAEVARFIASTRAAIARGSFDRVVTHWALPSAWPCALGARFHGPLEIVSHGADVRLLRALPGVTRRGIVERLLERGSWRFVSEALRDALATSLSPRLARDLRERSFVEPPALSIDAGVAALARARRDALGEGEVYVSAGRLVPSKRVGAAVDWVAQRARTVRDAPQPRLVVVGDGPERERLTRLAADLRVDARFVGATSRPEALAWIGAADALLFASRAEGLSTVLREAAALGVRVERI